MKPGSLISLLMLLLLQAFPGETEAQDNLQNASYELPTATFAEVGMDEDTIQTLLGLASEASPPDLRGIVVIKDGKLVIEEYYNTFWRRTIHDIRSAGKSITALLLGIAIDQGLIEDVEQPVYGFFSQEKYDYEITDEHRKIKIKHLLTMSSGLDADTDDGDTPGNAGNWMGLEDWVTHLLNVPMAFETGSKWVYTDACSMLIGAIIEETSGMNLEAFADKHLFGPLGIAEYYWYKSPKGQTAASGNLYLSTLDFAKLGYLIVNKGKWGEQQLISESWIEAVCKKRIPLPDYYNESHYGYFWYIGEREVEGKSYRYVAASGNGGNKIYALPDENLLVCVTNSAYGQGYGHGRAWRTFGFVLRSLEK